MLFALYYCKQSPLTLCYGVITQQFFINTLNKDQDYDPLINCPYILSIFYICSTMASSVSVSSSLTITTSNTHNLLFFEKSITCIMHVKLEMNMVLVKKIKVKSCVCSLM